MANLTGQNIKDTYQELVTVGAGNTITNGTGSLIANLAVTASDAINAATASFTPNALVTGTVNANVITLTKGDGSAINLTVATGSATSASYADYAAQAGNAVTADTATTASYATLANTAISALSVSFVNVTGKPTLVSGSAQIDLSQATGTAATATSASHAVNADFALTASYAANVPATASYALEALSSSYANNASTADSAVAAVSASHAINANSASLASLANQVKVSTASNSFVYQVPFVANDGNETVWVDSESTKLTYVPATNTLAGIDVLNATKIVATSVTASLNGNATTATSASFASTIADGLNINAASITASGAEFTNLSAVSASIGFLQTVTGSATIIGDAFILLNTSDATRYAGILVEDSGSATPVNYTASFQFDSLTNDWFYEYSGSDPTNFGIALFGPEYGTKGSPTYPTNNKLVKGNGGHHLNDSSITDDGVDVTVDANLGVASGSVLYVNTIEENTTNAGVAFLAGTAGFTFNENINVTGAVTASAGFKGDLDGNASTATSASYALTASFAENSLPAFPFDGDALISGSLGLTGSFSSFPTTVTAAAGTASVSGYTGSIFSVDATLGQYFDLTLVTASAAVLDVVNMKPGQQIYVRVSQSVEGIPNSPFGTNLQLNSNIYVPSGSSRYLPSITTGSVDQLTITYTDKLLCEYEKDFVNFTIEAPLGFVSASGGTVTIDGDYKIHTFTASGDFTVTSGGDISQYLIVAGGGGGGKANAGGGGAGGYFATGSDSDVVNVVTAQTYSVVVGAGGAGATTTPRTGSLGGDSSVFGITTYGGGGGGGINGGTAIYAGQSGGSGGGGSNDGGNVGAGGAPTSGSVAAALGFAGGSPSPNNSGPGGGGGGAGGAGAANSGNNGGAGGAGVANSITGTSLFYAGGGGGGSNATGGAGGSSVGGNGGSGSSVGANAVANRGSGGGGGAGGSANGGNGSTGVVIIRYKFQ